MFSVVHRRLSAGTGLARLSQGTSSLPPLRRSLNSASTTGRGAYTRSKAIRLSTLALSGVLGYSALIHLWKPVRADAEDDVREVNHRRQTPLTTLLRSYVVYSLCSLPVVIDYSPTILSALFSVPGIKQITEAIVRATFFSQFVGAETSQGSIPLLEYLRSENKGVLLAYSVEVDEHEAAGKRKAYGPKESGPPHYKQMVDEMIRSIDIAADFEDRRRTKAGSDVMIGRRTWVAVKMTALLPDAQALINLSSHIVKSKTPASHLVCFPGTPHPADLGVLDILDPSKSPESSLTKEDITALKELKEDLFRIGRRASERGVRIIIDAEYRFYQPAIDAYQLALMREFNRLPARPSPLARAIGAISWSSASREHEISSVQPLIYGTFQAYLRRTRDHVAQSLLAAEEGKFSLGVKLVRGAYHPQEVEAHHIGRQDASDCKPGKSLSISPNTLPPVWLNKAETDACYDDCVRMLIGRVGDDLRAIAESSKEGREDSATRKPRLGVLFGTHNWRSCELILEELVRVGAATRERVGGGGEVVRIGEDVAERVTLGQLYGMMDTLTNSLVDRTRSADPFVIKYVPYGALAEVMPYLGRRAIENKSVLGGGAATEERKRAGSEIAKRIYSFFG
ncbi:FAD-linked oxidoreductase [Phellopilus nigrolimitatus]|nr:FAD-linked oxidoreductase [Phellopilus nigrolimitatus]